jgi:hypothetical protein
LRVEHPSVIHSGAQKALIIVPKGENQMQFALLVYESPEAFATLERAKRSSVSIISHSGTFGTERHASRNRSS